MPTGHTISVRRPRPAVNPRIPALPSPVLVLPCYQPTTERRPHPRTQVPAPAALLWSASRRPCSSSEPEPASQGTAPLANPGSSGLLGRWPTMLLSPEPESSISLLCDLSLHRRVRSSVVVTKNHLAAPRQSRPLFPLSSHPPVRLFLKHPFSQILRCNFYDLEKR
jgi:hypothetical protein